jgi:Mrp family chromosome partitioning ATPase
MDSITKALQRAKTEISVRGVFTLASGRNDFAHRVGRRVFVNDSTPRDLVSPDAMQLSRNHLLASRIVAFDSAAAEARYYDILRNQLLNHKRKASAHVIAVTSPTAGCGATVTAANLALSFMRTQVSVLIVDANKKRPVLGRYLGLPDCDTSDNDDVASQARSSKSIVQIGSLRATILRATVQTGDGSVDDEQPGIATWVERSMRETNASVVVVDVPPMLSVDETIPVILGADSVVLVLATGQSKLSDLEACKTYLGSREGVQVVLNKAGRHGL